MGEATYSVNLSCTDMCRSHARVHFSPRLILGIGDTSPCQYNQAPQEQIAQIRLDAAAMMSSYARHPGSHTSTPLYGSVCLWSVWLWMEVVPEAD